MAVYLGNVQVSPLMSFDYQNDEPWVRPEGWPNLDNIYMPEDFEGVYMTFENFDSALCRKAGLNLSTNTVIDVGYLNEHDEFEPLIPQIAVTAAGYKIVDYSAISTVDYPYVIIRVLPATASAHIASCRFGRIPVADSGAIVVTPFYYNDCVERKGNLPYCTAVTYSGSDYGWMTTKMQKDATIIGSKVAITAANFMGAYYLGVNLREIDFTGWNTSLWTITSLVNVFYHCHKLKHLDLRTWDTSKWKITSMVDMFRYCINLIDINVSTWDVSDWGTSSITLASTFYYCNSLQFIYGLENWDTSAWNCTSLASTWRDCRSLNNLNISSWDTSNWKTTTINAAWYACSSLKKLDLSGWNTSQWKITGTGLVNAWYNCLTLQELKIGTWDTSNWTVTSLATVWTSCRELEEWEASQWHTPAWTITTIDQTFRYCYQLKEIDFSNWDCSEWALTTMAGFTSECYGLIKLDMHNIDIATIVTANNYGATSSSGANTILYCCKTLQIFNPPINWNGRIYFSTCYNLSRTEMIKFFNNLVDRSDTTAMALQIGTKRSELTSADIAIATAKNYTIS